MTWYTLASTHKDHCDLVARLLPESLVTDSTEPVLVVRFREIVDLVGVLERLNGISDSFTFTHSATSTSFTALLESDWEEWTITGTSIEIAHESYSTNELVDIAEGFRESLETEISRVHAQFQKLQDIEHFVTDLVVRAETKKSLSSKSATILDGQIDVLQRVLNRIRDA